MKIIEIVECISSGDGYIKGDIYPVIGYNDGVHIADGNGDENSFYPFNNGEYAPPELRYSPRFRTFKLVKKDVV